MKKQIELKNHKEFGVVAHELLLSPPSRETEPLGGFLFSAFLLIKAYSVFCKTSGRESLPRRVLDCDEGFLGELGKNEGSRFVVENKKGVLL